MKQYKSIFKENKNLKEAASAGAIAIQNYFSKFAKHPAEIIDPVSGILALSSGTTGQGPKIKIKVTFSKKRK